MIKKLFFGQIGNGGLAKHVQEEFELAQRVAMERGDSTTVVIKLKVTPPLIGECIGNVEYEVETKHPKIKSPEMVAEWDNGKIVDVGRDMAEILQTELDLSDHNSMLSFNPAAL